MKPYNLINTFVNCYPTQEAARRDLNAACGLRVSSGRMYDWRSGKHQPPPAAERYMVQVAVERAVAEALGEPVGKYTRYQYEALAMMLSVPARSSGRR